MSDCIPHVPDVIESIIKKPIKPQVNKPPSAPSNEEQKNSDIKSPETGRENSSDNEIETIKFRGNTPNQDNGIAPVSSDIVLANEKRVKDSVNNFNNCLKGEQKTTRERKSLILNPEKFLEVDFKNEKEVRIGEGGFGTVCLFKGEKKIRFAVKETEKPLNAIEITSGFKLKHPGIVETVAIMWDCQHFRIYMQYAGKSLRELIKVPGFLNNVVSRISQVAYELFSIVSWLTDQKICHRDIKLENIVAESFRDGFKFTIIDFGSAQQHDEKNPHMSGLTLEFLTPELARIFNHYRVLRSAGDLHRFQLPEKVFITENCDCYAIAMVLVCLLNNGDHPIKEANHYSPDKRQMQRLYVLQKVIDRPKNFFSEILFGIRIQGPLFEVLQNALHLDSKKRWSASDCCNYMKPYLPGCSEVNKGKVVLPPVPTNNCQQLQTNSDLNLLMKTGVKRKTEAQCSFDEDPKTSKAVTVIPNITQKPPVKVDNPEKIDNSQETGLVELKVKCKPSGGSIPRDDPLLAGNIPNLDLLGFSPSDICEMWNP